jgi:23S rRNA (uracil1939-C5)-methyltransferase
MNKLIQCTHFSLCSGCSLNECVDSPPVFKDVEHFFKSKGVTVHLHAGNATGWRYRAKLAIRGTANQPIIGLFREGSHDVVDIPFCQVHHPGINKAVEYLRQFIRNEKIEPYNESTCSGYLRYAQIIVEKSSGKVQLSLVWNSNEDSLRAWDLGKLWELNSSFWHSIWVNWNVRRDNVIFGKKWLLIKGEEDLWEKFGGIEVCFHPASFAQANLDLFEVMLKKINQQITHNENIVEYYAGVGVIGLTLASKTCKIRCVEISPEAEKCFEKSRSRLPPALKDKVIFQLGSAENMNSLLKGADTIIVDPPRKGIHKSLLKAIQEEESVNKIIYVSCGWSAFQKDCETLLSNRWSMQLAEAYVFFPGSNHIEILSVFTRSIEKI